MSHKHHSCKCEHEDVKFCKTCQIVHCLDCNKEWRQSTMWYNPYYLGGSGYIYNNAIGVSSGSLLGGGGGAGGSATLTTTTPQPTLTCEHKA